MNKKVSGFRSQVSGFTLVELLVTIGIIAILAAILLPAIRSAFVKAEKATCQSEVKSIENAIKAYYNEYAKYPHSGTGTDDHYGKLGGKNNNELMNVLRSVDAVGNAAFVSNPRKIVFLDFNASTNAATLGQALDPWDNQYEITVDSSFNNNSESTQSADSLVEGKGVVVWSYGPDGKEKTGDDICSWKQ